MNLRHIIENLFQEGRDTSPRILSGFSEAERFLEQAYEGRYLFELIQNVRDANKEVSKDGEVVLTLTDGVFSVLNSGAEFTSEGIRSITTIGDSTKQSQDYIGFKGIGFKSVQEISDTPTIVTLYGTVMFDRVLTHKRLAKKGLGLEQTPLFLLPNYLDTGLSRSETDNGFVTRIALPLRDSVDESKVVADFSKIGVEQLVLLGNLRLLEFRSKELNVKYSITKDVSRNLIEVSSEGKKTSKFRVYSPKEPVVVPNGVIEQLEGKEKRIFSRRGSVDISICLAVSESGHFQPVENAKLYLFYPLRISSGFRFLIHSYFIVNPERTALRQSSPLNDFLLKEIGRYIGGELNNILRRRGYNTSRILAFNRVPDSGLNTFYDAVVAELKLNKFIFDGNRHFRTNEVVIADGLDRGLFPSGKLNGKQLVYLEDEVVKEWLTSEFNIPYLSHETIAEEIEDECARQAKAKRIEFFQNLYNYVSSHPTLNLVGRKVLITDEWKLVSSEEDVFYGGGRRSPLKLSSKIRRRIHFIHKDIKISDFRDGKSRTGIIEFNTHELVKRVLRLFKNDRIPKDEILTALFEAELDAKSQQELSEHVLLPVKSVRDRRRWLSPLEHPILLGNTEILELYPDSNFVDEDAFAVDTSEDGAARKQEFLKTCGAWHIPPVHLSRYTLIPPHGRRDSTLSTIVNLTARPLTMARDRTLKLPSKFNQWWTRTLIENWEKYRQFIESGLLPRPYFYNSHSDTKLVPTSLILEVSEFLSVLRKGRWIVLDKGEEPIAVGDVVGIEPTEFHLPHFQVVKRYLRLLPISYSANKSFINSVGLTHFSAESLNNYVALLKRVHESYGNIEINSEREFVSFYNRILGKLFDHYSQYGFDIADIDQLRAQTFLARDEQKGRLTWVKATDIWYIDDKPNYDLLPDVVKGSIQPQFTNRDKHTFGKIAGRLGKRFSKMVKRSLLPSEILSTLPISGFLPHLPECLALVEAQLDFPLSREIDAFRNLKVVTHIEIKVEVRIEETEPVESFATHFVEDGPRYDIHLEESTTASHNRTTALAISEVFIKLLEREVGKLAADLTVFLDEPDKTSYLSKYEVSDERVQEIKNLLRSHNLSQQQLFWNAILLANETLAEQVLLVDSIEDEIAFLAHQLRIPEVEIKNFNQEFDFQFTGNPNNVEILFRLLSQLGISVEEINKTLFPKINFSDYFNPKLEALRNKTEAVFNERLYGYLSNKDITEQERYQDRLDRYKTFPMKSPPNIVKLDVAAYFLASVNREFDWLDLQRKDLDGQYRTFEVPEFFKKHYRRLSGAVKSIDGFSHEKLERFLLLNSRRSLLYFDKWQVLIGRFETWLAGQPQETKAENTNEVENILANVSLTGDEQIEAVSVRSVDASSDGGKTKSPIGRRWDGAGNEGQKRIIGITAEYLVYRTLKREHKDVRWVSKNASKVPSSTEGYNPEGDDSLGYDIDYLDVEGNKIFVEVKGRADDICAFEISQKEIEKAQLEKESYKIILVTNPLEPSKRRFRDLGNLFYSREQFDFLSNSRFLVITKTFEIRFRES